LPLLPFDTPLFFGGSSLTRHLRFQSSFAAKTSPPWAIDVRPRSFCVMLSLLATVFDRCFNRMFYIPLLPSPPPPGISSPDRAIHQENGDSPGLGPSFRLFFSLSPFFFFEIALFFFSILGFLSTWRGIDFPSASAAKILVRSSFWVFSPVALAILKFAFLPSN